MKNEVICAILAGGRGERLWPRSRHSRPKQALAFGGNTPLVSHCIARARGLTSWDNIFVVTGRGHLKALEPILRPFRRIRVIVEPEGRNTAPAIAAVTSCVLSAKPEAIIAVLPSDHLIQDKAAFLKTLSGAVRIAAGGDKVVTIGIPPQRPDTAYGYIEVTGKSARTSKALPVKRFVEKPSLRRARSFVRSGRYFWNSGIFVFRASLMNDLLLSHAPRLYRAFTKGTGPTKGRKIHIAPSRYRGLKAQSIDYAVMEKTDALCVVPASFGWNDIGSFTAAAEVLRRDTHGNRVQGRYLSVDTENSIIWNDSARLIAVLGLRDVVIVDTGDTLLVTDKNHASAIRKLTAAMRARKDLRRFL